MAITLTRGVGMVLFSGLLAGCAGMAQKDSGDATTPPKAPGTARAFLFKKCPLAPPVGTESVLLPALLAPFIKDAASSLIDTGYDYFLKVMSERQRQLTASTTFQATGDFYSIAEQPAPQPQAFYQMPVRCLVLIREADKAPTQGSGQQDGWETNRELVNGALTAAKTGYELQRTPTFYAEFAFVYHTLKVPPQVLHDEAGKPSRDRSGHEVRWEGKDGVPYEFEIKPVRVFYGQSGAARNSGDAKRLTVSVDLAAKTFEGQKWASVPMLAKTFDLGMVKAGGFMAESDLAQKGNAVAPIRPPGRITVRIPHAAGVAYAYAPDLVNMTATAILTESEDGSDIERWLYEKAKEKRDTLTDKAKGWVNDGVDRVTAKE